MSTSKLLLGFISMLAIMFSCRTDDVKPYVALTSKVTSISENSGVAVIYASLAVPTNEDIEITLMIGGTATGNGVDYTIDKTSMLISSGKLSDSIVMTAVQDALTEGIETVEFTIQSAVNAIPVANQTVIITIVDDVNLPDASTRLLTEDFNYNAGDALTTHGWIAHSGGTTNPVLVTAPGLTFTGYAGSNIGFAAGVNNTGQDVNKQFIPQTTPGSLYASFLVNATATSATGDYFIHFFDPNATTAHRARTFITSQAGQMLVGFSFNAATPQSNMTTLLNFGQTYLFVLKYTIADGALNDLVSLYVFAEGDDFSVEPATPTIGPLAGTAADIVPTGIALRQFDAAQRITVDGIRVKTVWQLNSDAVRQSVKK